MRETNIFSSERKEVPESVYFVASTSRHKIGAVENVLRELATRGTVEGYKAASGVNEQPVGHEETFQGAKNRLKNLEEVLIENKSLTESAVLVSFESGIYEVGGRWVDIGYVVVKQGERVAVAPSAGVEFPKEYVEEAKRRGFETATVGSVMAERLGNPDIGTDPHAYLTGGKITRNDLLQAAFKTALFQLQK